MKSIIQTEKECFICRTTYNLEDHHIFGGNNRKHSETYGLKVWLCQRHHTGFDGVHTLPGLMKKLHKIGQKAFEGYWGDREDFLQIFRRNYLG